MEVVFSTYIKYESPILVLVIGTSTPALGLLLVSVVLVL